MASRKPLAAMNIYNGNSFSLNIMTTKTGTAETRVYCPHHFMINGFQWETSSEILIVEKVNCTREEKELILYG